MESLLTFLSTWTTDAVITGWIKSHAVVSALAAVAIRTIINRTKTTLDNEIVDRIKQRFGMDK